MGLKEKYEIWEKTTLDKWLKENPERKERFVNDVGIEIERLYTPLHLRDRDFSYERDLGLPGEYPFTRGVTPTMYRSQPFILRAYAGFGTPEECNKRYRQDRRAAKIDPEKHGPYRRALHI